MKKFLLFVLTGLVCMFNADGAVRGENTATRGKNTPATSVRTTRSITSRTPIRTTVSARTSKPVSILTPSKQTTKTATRTTARSTTQKNVAARATTSNTSETETRTGAEYEQCKAAFFTCMDQFCQLKNDSFRRCSCSDRIFDFQDISETYQQASEKLTEFSENLDVVGMTKEQATAMKTASEGEDAMTEDKSASKQLLQAIMNSIKGEDSSVGGKYKDLNSITISSDISNAFGMEDSGQIIASYNGTTLYKAVYPKCRNAVKEDCNNASLQRAINAYLMAIEQDCNSVESALTSQQKKLKASTHQNSAMLDLARVENRRNHNSDDIATCLTNVEAAITSEEVCGAGYHKCLDYGQFIDVTTGAPLTGVVDFYQLGNLLTFKEEINLKDQKLSTIQSNRPFVQFFENKTKKFAKDALDKCTEDADFVWQQYLDQALLDIYYAQQTKITDVKQSCIDLVAKCYDNQNISIANAMANLTGDSGILLKPSAITLTSEICGNYIESCNQMFGENVIKLYMANKDTTDTVTACRAIAQQCFDNFGGSEYGNFYYPHSGLFESGKALDWFTLYDNTQTQKTIVSPCAQQVANTAGCADVLEEVFGGFDVADIAKRQPRAKGIATEVYYKIINNLTNHCNGLNGYFVEYKYATQYGYKEEDLCKIDSDNNDNNNPFYIDPVHNSIYSLVYWYHFIPNEDMCPAEYGKTVDIQSWGMCSCWENGGYRSKNGKNTTCYPILPSTKTPDNAICSSDTLCYDNTTSAMCIQPRSTDSVDNWCQQTVIDSNGKVCPTVSLNDGDMNCGNVDEVVMARVPNHK